MCQGENIMEDNRREEKEALKVLTEYSPKLLKSMRNVMEELHGNRQPDTDEYLLSIIKGMNWEIQVLNGTMDYLNEIEQLIDKQAANALFVNFSKIYQKKVYGGYFLPDFITDELIQNMNAVYQKQWNGEITVNHREIEFLLASEITRRERQEILTLLSNHFDVALYSGEQDVAIPKIRKKNYIDYYTQMPKAFKCSKVNLNISLKTIRTGIPLRVLDILASGGFVISNFQEELAEYFRLGEEIITYGDIEELYYLVNYYLQHEEERKEIADRGLQRVKEDFRFEERMKVILEDL